MKIVLATPLYPPEIAEPAPYIKELATRLAKLHDVTIVTYGRLPEKVPGVRIRTVSKHLPLPIRLVAYWFILARTTYSADILFAENGASVELPTALVPWFGCSIIVHRGDRSAHFHAQKSRFYGLVERLALRRAKAVIEDAPLPRPERMPFEKMPTETCAAYEHSWERHLEKITSLLTSYAKT